MSAAKETIDGKVAARTLNKPMINQVVDFLSSVSLGVSLLIILVVLSIIGMVIIQQNVQGFDSYYASLTPAERTVYGGLGIFDIYHSWYYNVLLLILSLNIILASIDRFPTAWAYIVKPKIKATKDWLLNQKVNTTFTLPVETEAAAAEHIKRVFESEKLKTVVSESETTEYGLDEEGRKDFKNVIRRKRIVVFGETGKFNRIGAYIVHVALLTLFLGHFVALRTGFDADVRMIPGDESDQIQMIQFDLDKRERFNVQLPFSIKTTDIQQKLIDPNGSIEVPNTLDWRTQIKITDPQYGETVADVSLNKPFSYRGYRFFQASAITMGSARNIDLRLTSQTDGSVTDLKIPRNGSAQLADGTLVEFEEFLPDFFLNGDKPDTRSGEYNNPAAILGVTSPGAQRIRVIAMGGAAAQGAPMLSAPKAGFKWALAGFEKSPFAHVLSIKYDPYNGAFIAWYFGGFGLIGALVFVFAFSHRRVWGLIEPNAFGGYSVTLGGDTNRNDAAFEERFAKLVAKMDPKASSYGE